MTTATAAHTSPVALKPGDRAPDFSLPADGSSIVALSAFKGKNVVVYFYPKDDTPGCTQESKDFRDHAKEFSALNAVILGVSRDSVSSHEKFKEKYCLPFPLLADEEGDVCKRYGVWVEKSMYGRAYMGIERTTFLIDGQGTVRHVWRKVKVERHVQEVLAALKPL